MTSPDAPRPPEPFDEADDMCPNCVTPWKCNGPHLDDQTPRAARSASPDPDLDVERLARAMVAVMTHPDRPLNDGFEWYGAANDLARDVAAEYARLSSPTDEESR